MLATAMAFSVKTFKQTMKLNCPEIFNQNWRKSSFNWMRLKNMKKNLRILK